MVNKQKNTLFLPFRFLDAKTGLRMEPCLILKIIIENYN